MNRRRFIKTSAMVSFIPHALSSCNKNHNNDKGISGFIFSDAHIGWKGKSQPTLETQAKMIQVIRDSFPRLDLVFDTGDVHHSYVVGKERKQAREFWLNQMAGQFHDSIFHYIPGNHELSNGVEDAEATAGQLGSFVFRPYYSFDYKGIHFVSLPQLLDTVFITKETVNWLKQDLTINANKTTMIFSHNSISGTTYSDGDIGYRETINSDEILEVINHHEQVLAWFHGHNHQYEIVSKHNRLYVSNGRIGGFNPPKKWGSFGQGHLGGIFFHIDKKGIEVKCFSATEKQFMDQLGLPHLSQKISTQTSYEPNKNMSYYFGHGKLSNYVNHKLYGHYLSEMRPEVFISSNRTREINENGTFTHSIDFSKGGKDRRRIMGFRINPSNTKYTVTPKGLEIVPQGTLLIQFPKEKYRFDSYLSRSGYYRCALGQTMKLEVEFYGKEVNKQFYYDYKLMSKSHKTLFQNGFIKMNSKNGSKYDALIKLPSKISEISAEEELYIFITLKVDSGGDKIIFHRVQLKQVSEFAEKDRGFELVINKTPIKSDALGYYRLPNKDLFKEGKASIELTEKQHTHSVLFHIPEVKWQIRNAIATLEGNIITIHRMRSEFQSNQEVIITPTGEKNNYIAKTRNILECKIILKNKLITIETKKIYPNASIMVESEDQIQSISGGVILRKSGIKSFWLSQTSEKMYVEFS